MTAINFIIHLTSDAEPGTGFGGELVNDFIPRNAFGVPELPASHIKGLMRSALVDIARTRHWTPDLILEVFGDVEHQGIDDYAAFKLSNAELSGAESTALVARTAVTEGGIAQETSLRTTECIATGSAFCGQIYPTVERNSIEDLAWRLALLSVFAVGSNRNRGSGSCYIEIDDEKRSPGELVKTLNANIESWTPRRLRQVASPAKKSIQLTGKSVVLQLVFRAQSPICCPEIPDKSNVMTTGFSIPASAVQGVLLTEINRQNPELADALFEHPVFRAWPMQPCFRPNDSSAGESSTELPTSAVRVSLTHRAAKYSVNDTLGTDDFHDEALEPKNSYKENRKGAPLKASDGVLLRYKTGEVKLWRASDMPHVITSHGVHSENFFDLERERNVFTVDAMAPLVWMGLVVVPEDAVAPFQEVFSRVSTVSIGKSRTVRGLGTLEILPLSSEVPEQWKTHGEKTVWIVQSPIPIERSSLTIQETFRSIADGWGSLCGVNVKKVWANSGVLFGWNRHNSGRQAAQAVVLPGSVVEFEGKVNDSWTQQFFTSGQCVPNGRKRGFGALSVHPGKASRLYDNHAATPAKSASLDHYAKALKIVIGLVGSRSLPSVSQIRAVQQRISNADTRDAIRYLDKQINEKTTRVWAAWDECHGEIRELLFNHPRCAYRALEVFADLTAAKGSSEA